MWASYLSQVITSSLEVISTLIWNRRLSGEKQHTVYYSIPLTTRNKIKLCLLLCCFNHVVYFLFRSEHFLIVHFNTNVRNYFQWHCHNIKIMSLKEHILLPEVLENAGTISDLPRIAEVFSSGKSWTQNILHFYIHYPILRCMYFVLHLYQFTFYAINNSMF